jgi:hypothetical protein
MAQRQRLLYGTVHEQSWRILIGATEIRVEQHRAIWQTNRKRAGKQPVVNKRATVAWAQNSESETTAVQK